MTKGAAKIASPASDMPVVEPGRSVKD